MTDKIDDIIAGMDGMATRAFLYHASDDRGPCSGSMAEDLNMVFSGLLDFTDDGRLQHTSLGQQVRTRLQEQTNDA